MFADTDLAREILAKRYYAKNETDPEQLLERVAVSIANTSILHDDVDAQELAQSYYEMMHDGKFIPNSPCLVNAGRGGGLFACFVLGMDDNLSSITKAKADAMAITKFGGGWGIPLGNLRPQGAKVMGSTHGIAGGPIGFWETFSHDMRTMTQGGFRDAACMATMPIDHPDIVRFVNEKSPVNSLYKILMLGKLIDDDCLAFDIATELLDHRMFRRIAETHMSNFNISVLATDKFMELALSESDTVYMPTSFDGVEYNGVYPAHLLMDIARGAWGNGEPGIIFIDTIRNRTRYNPEEIVATNPCSEQALPANGSCCLGSINLAEFVLDNGELDRESLVDVVHTAVRFLDGMITANNFPTEETREWSLHNRAIGLGVMGWADMLIKMGMRYDSNMAVSLGKEISKLIRHEAENASIYLHEAAGDGVGWPSRDGAPPMRNRALLSIAPTGTISLLAGCSPGIEPVYNDVVTRVDGTGTHEIPHVLSSHKAFVSLKDIEPEWVIKHVAAWSKSIDNSVSYTVNIPNESSVHDVVDLITLAWESECNGIAIYRDGSRTQQVLNVGDVEDFGASIRNGASASTERPHRLSGNTYKYSAQISGEKSNVYVTVNSLDGRPWEIFVMTPHIQDMSELQLVTTATRLTSRLLRLGDDPIEIVRQLKKVEGQSLQSIPAVLAKALLESCSVRQDRVCPDCGADSMDYTGGCMICTQCGYSLCS